MDLSNLKNNEKIIKRKNDYFKGKAESEWKNQMIAYM